MVIKYIKRTKRYTLRVYRFLIHRKDFVVVKRESAASYESKKPSGQDAHLADKKLVVNDTARARRISQARFFVLSFRG